MWRRSEFPALLVAVAGLLIGSCGSRSGPTADDDLEAATLQLTIETCGALAIHTATAVVVDIDRSGAAVALTVAHALDSYESFVVTDRTGTEHTAEVAFTDPSTDTALLRLPAWPEDEPRLGVATSVDLGPVRLVAYGLDGIAVQPSEVLRRVRATINGEDPRRAIEIVGDIDPGDSGAPVVDADGNVVGVVFATARAKETGWAVDAGEYLDILAAEPVLRETVPAAC